MLTTLAFSRTIVSTLALLLATALIATGCTKAGSPTVPTPSGSAANSSDNASASQGSATEGSATEDTGSASASHSISTPVTPASPTTSPPPSPTSTPVAAGCAASSLTITVQRGSAAPGHQYATVQFQNTSSKSCPLAGFPGIQLLKSGAPIGTSVRSGATAKTITLAPGASATSQLINDSTCNADTSDSVQVIAPNTTVKVVAPLAFRGCTVSVDPVVSG